MAVLDRLSQATPAQNHACLLDACIEAMDQYRSIVFMDIFMTIMIVSYIQYNLDCNQKDNIEQ